MTYSALAPFYDAIMWHVEYHEWVFLIEKIIKKFLPQKSVSIFEVGSGTGSLANSLKNHPYKFVCSDLNYNMSIIAKEKKLPVINADARFIPIKCKFDLVLFLYDGINYLQSLNEYKKLFLSVSSILPYGGLFLFDITTDTNSKRYFYDYYSWEEHNGSTIFRHSYYNDKKNLQFNDFTIFSPLNNSHDLFIKSEEQHIQKIFSTLQIESVIPKKIFKILGIWDNFSMLKHTKNSERIHFLLQKISQ